MSEKVSLLLFVGGKEESEVERMVNEGREAVALDTIEKAMAIPSIDRIIVATNSHRLARRLRHMPVQVEFDVEGEEFHFGRRLRQLIEKYRIERPFYMGGGSGALLSTAEMEGIVEKVLSAEEILVTNNLYSTDFAAFVPGEALAAITPPATDNDLGWLLREEAGLKNYSPPRTAGTQLDVDTPADLMTLSYHPAVGRHARRYLDSLALDTSHIEMVMPLITSRDAEILVAGRVAAPVWAYLETETACRVRIFSEERGMRASGRQERGEVRSLLGYYIEEVGVERFFATLGELGDAAFLDTRVIFGHLGLWPPASDRFYSDLRQPDKIAHPFVRDFTAAAIEAPIPVVLGGHSLVSGGLYALIEAAWAGKGEASLGGF